MAKGFCGMGHCCRCGDQNGPWSLYPGIGWLCDRCAEEEDKNNVRETGTKEDK